MSKTKPASNTISDEQFAAMLLRDEATESHLPDEDVRHFKQALSSYRRESLLWAEQRSAAMPSLAAAAERGRAWAAVPQWALAAVAAFTLAAGAVHIARGTDKTAKAEPPAAITGSLDDRSTPKQIADDNALLMSIDAAVNAGSGLPVRELGLNGPASSVSHAGGSVN